MSGYHRLALAVTAAISALVLSSSAAAHATTAQAPKATASGPHSSSSLSTAATPNFPSSSGWHQLWPAYPNPWCLYDNGRGLQTTMNNCASGFARWTINRTSRIYSDGGAWVTIRNLQDGLCLDAEDDAGGHPTINGDHVNAWPCDGAAQQYWYIFPLGDGTWGIFNDFNFPWGKWLDCNTNNIWNPARQGDQVQLWDHNGQPQQKWIIS